MKPLFTLNEDAWEDYKQALSNSFKKSVPVILMFLDGLAFMQELEKNKELDHESKMQLLKLHIGTKAAEYGVQPDGVSF